MDLYREEIIDHYKNPCNFGELENPYATHEENNPFCGDRICMQIERSKVKGQLSNVFFNGEGCAISIASASMLTEKVKSMDIKDLRNMDKNDILKMLKIDLSPTRLKCAMLPLEVLQKLFSSRAIQHNKTI